MSGHSDLSGEITELLHRWREGSAEAENQLFEIVMPNLRKLAHYLMKGERDGHPLQATELVSEAYVRLVAAKDRDWQSRKHFFAITARVMRRFLTDLARQPKADIEPLVSDPNILHRSPREETLFVGELLDRLEREHADWCMVVEMKHFLGFTDDEVAQETGFPLRTAQRMWLDARKWLSERMDPPNAKRAGR